MKNPSAPTSWLRQYIKTELFIEIAAAAMMALGIRVFSAPNRIVGGGLSGIASVLFTVFGFPIGATTLLLNIPLLFIAWRRLGRDFLLATLRMVLYVALMTDNIFAKVPPYHGEQLLAALFGGILLGSGLGLILMRGASTGGTDIVVKLISRYRPNLSLGAIVLMTDLAVVLTAAAVYQSIETILYGLIMIYTSSRMIDGIIARDDARKLAVIITGQGERVAQALLQELSRGVTIIPATGAFTGEQRAVLLCVVDRSQLSLLKRLVSQADPSAFVTVTNASETLGKGFKPMGRA